MPTVVAGTRHKLSHLSIGTECATARQSYPSKHWPHRRTGKHWSCDQQSLLPLQRFPLRVMAAKFLRRSDTHQYGAARKSIGHSDRRPHIPAAKHGSTSAANVSALSDIDNHSRSAAVPFNGNHHRQHPGGSTANTGPLSEFQRWRRFRRDESKWTWWRCVGNGCVVTERVLHSVGCVDGFQFVRQWIWNWKKFQHFRQSKWTAERWEVSQWLEITLNGTNVGT